MEMETEAIEVTSMDLYSLDYNDTTQPATMAAGPNFNLAEVILWGCLSCFIFLTNTTMLLIIAISKRMWMPTSLILCSMFISSIIYSILYILPQQILRYYFPVTWICSIFSLFEIAFIMCLNLHLFAISFEKYSAVVSPLKYRLYSSRYKHYLIILLVIWLIAVFISILPIAISGSIDVQRCSLPPLQIVYFIIYLALVTLFLYFLPLMILLVTSVKVGLVFKCGRGLRYYRSKSLSLTRFKRYYRDYRNNLYLLCIYVVFVLPYIIALLHQSIIASQQYWGMTISQIDPSLHVFILRMIALFYVALNPLIMSYYNVTLKLALLDFLGKTPMRPIFWGKMHDLNLVREMSVQNSSQRERTTTTTAIVIAETDMKDLTNSKSVSQTSQRK
ncbi:Alpha-2B adrenergic receptor [Trichoplax sp. H2]|nr:Alpha-2B adrenergic receptor [Trichoplax sp. H2]|eukprot:RDD36364.1 Alpha-2B adrenergic receptor [Trichoplax sp. H2]